MTWPIDNTPVPVAVRGTLYHSQMAAAKALGVTRQAVQHALESGTVDKLGTGKSKAMPVEIDGITYPSINQAVRATGLGRDKLTSVAKDQAKKGVDRGNKA